MIKLLGACDICYLWGMYLKRIYIPVCDHTILAMALLCRMPQTLPSHTRCTATAYGIPISPTHLFMTIAFAVLSGSSTVHKVGSARCICHTSVTMRFTRASSHRVFQTSDDNWPGTTTEKAAPLSAPALCRSNPMEIEGCTTSMPNPVFKSPTTWPAARTLALTTDGSSSGCRKPMRN